MATTHTGQPMGYATSTTRPATRPTSAERTEAEALLTRPEMLQRLRRDRSELVEMPLDPTPETATGRLARLAVRQAGHQGEPALGIEVPHPRFAQAVEAATAAPDKQRALEAATAILKGPEAAKAFQDHPPPPGEAMANPSNPPTDQATIALTLQLATLSKQAIIHAAAAVQASEAMTPDMSQGPPQQALTLPTAYYEQERGARFSACAARINEAIRELKRPIEDPRSS